MPVTKHVIAKIRLQSASRLLMRTRLPPHCRLFPLLATNIVGRPRPYQPPAAHYAHCRPRHLLRWRLVERAFVVAT